MNKSSFVSVCGSDAIYGNQMSILPSFFNLATITTFSYLGWLVQSKLVVSHHLSRSFKTMIQQSFSMSKIIFLKFPSQKEYLVIMFQYISSIACSSSSTTSSYSSTPPAVATSARNLIV